MTELQDNSTIKAEPSKVTSSGGNAKPTPEKENVWINLLVNIVAPTLILMKLSGEDKLGATYALIVALAFPIGYGIYDYFKRGKLNFFSALGVVSVMLTGGIALLKLPPEYIAIKEAAIPALFGIAVLVSLKTPFPLVKKLLLNPQVLEVEKINTAVEVRNSKLAFERALSVASMMLAGAFFLSSALNYGLAKYLLKSDPGTEAFNAELGKMTALSYPVISIPTMIVFFAAMIYLFAQIKKHTGLTLENNFVTPDEK